MIGTTTKIMAWAGLVALLLFASGCAISESKFVASDDSSLQRALIGGEIKEALAAYEVQAREAEKNALASLFPQQYWEIAATAYTMAARAAQMSGQLQKTITYAEKALETAERAKTTILKLRAIGTLISAYSSVRNFDKTREFIDKGFTVLKEGPTDYNRLLYLYLGTELMRQREYEKAIDAFSSAVDLSRAVLGQFSNPGFASGPSAAWSSRTEALESSRRTFINAIISLSNAYRQAGKLREAAEGYEQASHFIEQWKVRGTQERDIYAGMGEIYFRGKDYAQALENFNRALTLAESQRTPAAIRSASVRVGDIFRQTGKPSDAIPHYEKAVQQIESIRSLLRSEEYRQSFFEGGLRVYASMVGAQVESGKPEEAFNYSEHARSRAFLDLVGSKAQLSRAKSGLLEEERTLQERIAATKTRLVGETDGETNRSGLGKELAAAEQAYNSFLAKVRKQDKEQASLMAVEPLTLKQVQELLDSGQTLIEYFGTESEVLVWVVEKDKLNFQRVALSKFDLARQVKTLREIISNLGDARELNTVSTSLYKSLIQPLVPYISGKELIIVPHDVLHYLPFQALLGTDNRYLVEKYSINYLSSASLLQFTKEKSRALGERVLALGNPDLGDPKMNLEFAEIEAKEIKNLYPQSTIYLEKEATEEKAKNLSPQNDIIHFASHAELNEDDPLSSAVLLAKSDKEDGRLEVREIFGMDLKASLVVLSACETGLGKLSSGDELVGLTRAFIYAGSPSVVASLWNVEDSSTAQLMASFYENLKTMTKVEALRQAQLNLIRGNVNSDLLARRGIGGIGKLGETPTAKPVAKSISNPPPASISTSHPYFWAPFILVGEGK